MGIVVQHGDPSAMAAVRVADTQARAQGLRHRQAGTQARAPAPRAPQIPQNQAPRHDSGPLTSGQEAMIAFQAGSVVDAFNQYLAAFDNYEIPPDQRGRFESTWRAIVSDDGLTHEQRMAGLEQVLERAQVMIDSSPVKRDKEAEARQAWVEAHRDSDEPVIFDHNGELIDNPFLAERRAAAAEQRRAADEQRKAQKSEIEQERHEVWQGNQQVEAQILQARLAERTARTAAFEREQKRLESGADGGLDLVQFRHAVGVVQSALSNHERLLRRGEGQVEQLAEAQLSAHEEKVSAEEDISREESTLEDLRKDLAALAPDDPNRAPLQAVIQETEAELRSARQRSTSAQARIDIAKSDQRAASLALRDRARLITGVYQDMMFLYESQTADEFNARMRQIAEQLNVSLYDLPDESED